MNRHEIIEELTECALDGMDFDSLWQLAKEYIEDQYFELTDEELCEAYEDMTGEEIEIL